MKLKALFLSAVVALGLAGSAKAQFVQNANDTNGDGYAIMWLSGNFQIKKSSSDMTNLIVLSSTDGLRVTYGIVCTTAQITGLLSGVQAAFSSWITASSGTFTSTATASIINVSSITINGVPYTFPSTDGTSGQVLTKGTGGAVTWTTPAAAGTAAGVKPYTLVIGTPGSPNVDAYVSDLNTYNLLLASAGLMGLTNSTTAQAEFYWKNGSYPIALATTPAGLTNYFASTAVWVFTGSAAQQLVKNYGKMIGWTADIGQKTFASRLIEGCSNSLFLNPTVYGTNFETDGTLSSVWYFHNAIDARAIGITQKDGYHISGVTRYGDGSNVYVETSSRTILNYRSYTMGFYTNNGTFMGVKGSTGTDISGDFYNMAANGIVIQDGSMMTKFHDFNYYVANTGADQGSVVVAGIGTGATSDISTATLIMDGYIWTNNIATTLISVGNVSKKATGVYISNVHAVCRGGANTVTFLNLAAGSEKTVISNSGSDGCNTYIADSGVSTQNASRGNTKDGVAQ